MNKGNLNKLVTNYPVQLTNEEVENLSLTLSAVRTSGGGGGEGKTYHGEGFVSVNNTNNSISLTTEANEKLNQPIPTKVSDLSDSANYQTVAGMDEYLTTANAQTLYQTKEAMSAYATIEWTNDNFISEQELAGSVVPVVEAAGFAYKSYVDGELNKKENKLTFAYDNDKISAINGSAFAGQGGVTGDYYSASNPSGFINSTQAETQILEKHYLTEASGNSLYVPIPEGLSDGQYYAMTTSSWKVIQGAGDVSGISTVAHDDTLTGNGNNENLGVDTTVIQTKLSDAEIQNITDVTTLKTASSTWDNVSAKLNTTDFNTYTATTAPSIYQPKGNYAPESITADVNTLTAASAGWNNKVDKPTSLVNQYLVLRTDNAGNVSGWCDFQDQSYSKAEAQRTFVATANIDTTTLSGDGKSVSTKLGVKTDVIATKDYVNGSFLPLSGGTVTGDVTVSSNGTCLLAVGTEATLMGQSRVVNMGDTTARGTNWLGVSQLNQGFLKYVNGGNVGALNGTSIQINFAPDGANSYGNITVNSQDNLSKVVHVPTASYDSMSSFDNTNGPNYMLRKTASGFDIGACVINVTQLPAQTEANTYYFIYDT